MFPLNLPLPTAAYLTLYLATLVIHVVFMNYVLAGASYLLLTSPSGRDRDDVSIWRKLLIDWLPFATGLAITAGVAPLLFVQILYQTEFYSANLLLFHRWMAILPILIACFYLLYVLKSEWLAARGRAWRSTVCLLIFAGFAFIAWSWTENHLLSLDREAWRPFYVRGGLFYRTALLPSRLAMWFIGAFATLACLLMWQVRWTPALAGVVTGQGWRRLAVVAIGGVAVAGVAATVHFLTLSAAARAGIMSWSSSPYLAGAVIGAAVQLAGWWRVYRLGEPTAFLRSLVTAGCLATIGSMAALREVVRLSSMDLATIEVRHQQALRSGGFVVFLVFFAINAVLITWCAVQVRRATMTPGLEH